VESGSKVLWGCGSLLVVGVIGLVLLLITGAQVSAGNVGVVSSFGAVDASQTPYSQGFHWVMPFTTHIESVSVQPQNHKFNEVSAASKELQNVYVDGGVNYHVDSTTAAKLVIAGGVDAIVSKVFDPAFQDYIKTVVPSYTTEEILPNRDNIRNAVKAKLAEKAQPYGLIVDDIFLTNIHFDKDYTAAIEAKQVAQQKLEQAKIDASTAAQVAEGQAAAQIATAKGDAEANRLRQQYLTAELILYLEIQKWNGTLPTTVGVGGVFATIGH
jgi:prohibitin 2